MPKKKISYPQEVEADSTASKTTFEVQFDATTAVKSREVSKVADSFTVFPFGRDGSPKYTKLRYITFEGLKGKFPRGFQQTFTRGYGFTKYLAPIASVIQDKLDVQGIIVSKSRVTKLYKNHLVLSMADLDTAFPVLIALIKEQRGDTEHVTTSLLNKMLPANFLVTAPKYPKGGLASYIKKKNLTEAQLSAEDVESLVDLFKAGGKSLGKAQVLATKQLIEEFYIEDVLSEMEALRATAGTGKNEEAWQAFFTKYNWIFSQFFSAPVILFKDKAYVGGKSLDDSDGKVADFLYKNSLTQNVAIIEIKTHKTALLRSKPYRGTDVFAMSEHLSGAIGQVLNQRDNLQKAYNELRTKSTEPFETHSAKCLVVIGSIKGHKPEEIKAFELFRSNSKDVEIYTFDEVYERLRALQALIQGKMKVAKRTPAKKKPSAKVATPAP